jgi:hypothetical protein
MAAKLLMDGDGYNVSLANGGATFMRYSKAIER